MATSNKSLILQWIRKLRSRRSQSGEFEYKPLLVLAVLEILDKNPEHPNSFQYEELFEASRIVANRNNWEIDEQQFAHPYIRLKNDRQPCQVWIPQPIKGIDLECYEVGYPPHVRRDIPSIKINDYVWKDFQSLDDRTSFEKEIEYRFSWSEDSEELPLFSTLERVNSEITKNNDQTPNIIKVIDKKLESEDFQSSIENYSSIQDGFSQEKYNDSLQRKYSLHQLAEETNVEVDLLKKWIRVINRKKQAIFYGPPGTGKTFIIIIGTMNTADRSIALVDYALRRRFAFIKLLPDYDLLIRYHRKVGNNFPIDKLTSILKRLNQTIGDQNYEIGVSFFMDKDLENNLEDIWVYEIEPYIEECFFDQNQKINSFRWDKILEELNK